MNLYALAILFAAGFAARKTGLINEAETECIPKLLFTFFYPALTVSVIGNLKFSRVGTSIGIVAGLTAVTSLLTFVLSGAVLRKFPNWKQGILLHFQSSVGNVAYVLLPIAAAVWGPKAVSCCVVISSVQDVLIWTVYYAEFAGVKKGFGGLKQFISPVTIMLFVGLIVSVFHIKITGFVNEMLLVLSNAVSPLAFLYLGSVIAAEIGGRRLKLTRESMAMSLFRVTVLPAAVYFSALLIGAPKGYAVITALSFATPLPVMAVVWSQMFRKDTDFAIADMVLSTFLFFAFYLILTGSGALRNVAF